jgi:hypothetical protein
MASVIWAKNRGRNGWDSLVDVGLDESVESLNVHLYNDGLGTRRGGSTLITTTGVTAPIYSAFEFIPGQDETAAELFVFDNSSPIKILRCAGGSSFTSLTLIDDVSSAQWLASSAVLNGKLYLAYDSAVNRLHVFDPGGSTTTVRRAGLAVPAAATVANSVGGGAYAATLRYYKVAYTVVRSSVVVYRSELSPAVSFTPDGSHASAVVTKPASISESETNWEVYGSPDGILYYALAADLAGALGASIVVGTTTYADSTVVSTYANYTAQEAIGSNTPFPSVKSIGTDGSRLYGLGVWETSAGDSLAPKAGRFYFGPVLDSSDVNDDERINNTASLRGWIDLARNANAADRGVSPHPVNNVIYAFQSSGVFGLYPTDSAVTPYRRVVLSTAIGNLNQRMIVMGHDRNGSPCCYFWDPVKGPYVVGGVDGLRWIGKDLADIAARVNRLPDGTLCGGFYQDRQQLIFAVAVDGSTEPNLAVVCDITKQQPDETGDLRGGWTLYSGDFAAARAIVLFSNTLSATRSRVKVPYVSSVSAGTFLKYDESVNQDNSVSFQAYVTSGPRFVENAHVSLVQPYVMADAASAVTIRHRLIRNAGLETRDTTLTLTAEGSETIVLKKAEDAAMNDAWTLQVQLGDASSANVHWLLHQWRCPNVKVGSNL